SDRKSFTGWTFVVAGAAINWESKKQPVVALSTTEAEYIALSSAAKEAVYIRKLWSEMGLGEVPPIVIHSDNQSAQCLVKNPVYHARSKHIDIRYHHVRDMFKEKIIDLRYVSTENMMADVLTKNLSKVKHLKCINMMGLL
ncbi:hypothetical protein KR059_009031, partial [Drosophila kikkawai]